MEIQGGPGGDRKFSMTGHNTGPDGGNQYYSRDFLYTPFLDAFGEGRSLSWRTDKGAELASWPLDGAAEARDAVRKYCSF